MNSTKKILLSCLFLGIIHSTFGQIPFENPLFLQNDFSGRQSIENHCTIFIDSTGCRKFEDLDLAKFSSFYQLNVLKNPFKNAQYNYWLHFKINSHIPNKTPLYLNIGEFDRIEIFKIEDATLQKHNYLGRMNKHLVHSSDNSTYFYKLDDQNGKLQEYFVKIEEYLRFDEEIRPVIFTEKEQQFEVFEKFNEKRSYFIISIIFLGIIFFIWLFTFLQYFLIKDLSYLLYSIYLMIVFLYFLRSLEANFEVFILFSFIPSGVIHAEPFLQSACFISYVLFIPFFLNLMENQRRISKPIVLLVFISIVNLLLHAIFVLGDFQLNSFTVAAHYFFLFAICSTLFYIIIKVWELKTKLAYFIVTGFLMVVFGVVITMFITINFSELYTSVFNTPQFYLQLFILLEILFYSLGLAYKTRITKNENITLKETKIKLINLLNVRKLIHESFQKSAIKTEEKRELDFLGKALQILEVNYSNENFTVEKFAELMFISRMQLHRKLKEETGKSTSDLIKNYRIEKAKTLLTESDFTISEIAFKVGFKNTPYFSRVFSQKVGVAPSLFKKMK